MQRRLPKRGFKNVNRVEFVAVNLSLLETLVKRTGNAVIGFQSFVDLGVAKTNERVKILGKGKLTSKVEVTAHAISDSARSAIEAAGGSVTIA